MSTLARRSLSQRSLFPGRSQAEAGGLSWLERVWLSMLFSLLLVYMLAGKGAAYFSVSVGGLPLYVGEIVLAAGFAIWGLRMLHLPRQVPAALWVLLAWLMLASLHLFSDWKYWGTLAMRDFAAAYYATYAFLMYALMARARTQRIIEGYIWLAPLLAAGGVVTYLLTHMAALPSVPGTDVPLLYVKPGDFAMYMMSLLILMLYLRPEIIRPRMEWLALCTITCASLGFFLSAIANRGGAIAGMAGLAVATLLTRHKKRIVLLIAAVAIALFILASQPWEFSVAGREVSVDTLKTWVRIALGDRSSSLAYQQEGRTVWRLEWWQFIVQDAWSDSHWFWWGRGFGENLGFATGFFSAEPQTGVRSPHNISLTVLGRMGVPGLALWLTVLVLLLGRLVRSIWRARLMNRHAEAATLIWCLSFITMCVVDAHTDVFLEGPVGAIWFWSAVGYALAVAHRLDYAAAPEPSLGNRR